MRFAALRSALQKQSSPSNHRPLVNRGVKISHDTRPAAAFRQRGASADRHEEFNAPEDWHEPVGRALQFVVHPAGEGYVHPVTAVEVQERLQQLPAEFTRSLEVVQFSTMTRKRRTFPCYGMQWGPAVYLYPIEDSLAERYAQAPRPQQLIEARMFGGRWVPDGRGWRLVWTERALKDFYLHNVLIHEIGHLNDPRNTRYEDRERFANWFAIEYGYRPFRRGEVGQRCCG